MKELFQAIGLGLVVLLPLANPLTTVALFLGLSGNMNSAERNRQSLMASVYVFTIMMVAYYAGQVVMNTFGISIPGLRIAGGLIVAFIGFRMLFPQQKAHESLEAQSKSEELKEEPTANIAFVPLAMPSNAKHCGAGDDSDDHQFGIDGKTWRKFPGLGDSGGATDYFRARRRHSLGLLTKLRGDYASGGERGD